MSTSNPASPPPRTFLGRLPLPERTFLGDALRQETTGGVLLLIAAVLGIVAANSGFAEAYESLAAFEVGPAALDLHISIEYWASDGLLAIFFFIAGLELKRELLVGSLSDRREAVLPVAAALCGMVVPAVVFLAIAWGSPGATAGWAIPMATDIAFALAVLAVVGRALPPALRAFLLTLAVVDDMGAILVIALFYTDLDRPGSARRRGGGADPVRLPPAPSGAQQLHLRTVGVQRLDPRPCLRSARHDRRGGSRSPHPGTP